MDPIILVTASGNLFYADGSDDYLIAGINNTTAIAAQPISFATPKPSSLVLLGTGAFSLIGAARRKVAP